MTRWSVRRPLPGRFISLFMLLYTTLSSHQWIYTADKKFLPALGPDYRSENISIWSSRPDECKKSRLDLFDWLWNREASTLKYLSKALNEWICETSMIMDWRRSRVREEMSPRIEFHDTSMQCRECFPFWNKTQRMISWRNHPKPSKPSWWFFWMVLG